jgi:chromosome segregation ATPase
MQYLVAQMLMCLLGAALIGLLIGWLLWGMLVQRSRERVRELEQRVSKLSGYPARLTDLEGTHAAFVLSKNEEGAKGKARITELENLLKNKGTEAPTQVESHADKDERLAGLLSRIAILTSQVDELEKQAAQMPQLKASLEAQGSHIATLGAQLEQHAAAQADKNAQLTQLASLPPKEPAVVAESRFYEVAPVTAPNSSIQEPPDHVREFEKLLADLHRIEASKDAEIDNLRSRLAEIEMQPDPNLRREILFSAKNAELTHMRAVLNALFQPLSHDEVALRAYGFAQQRGFYGGSPTEDWLRAERDSHFGRLANAWESTRTGTMF